MSMNTENSFRIEKESTETKSFFSWIENHLNVEPLFGEGLPLKYFPYILYVTLIGIIYIGNSHYAEKTMRRIHQLQVDVENLRADYITLKADYMFDSKQSEVAKKVESEGLEESTSPPIKIISQK